MKEATATLEGVSPISFGRHYTLEKLDKENPKDYETRTWRERLHVDENGIVRVPPMMIKNALADAAKFLGIQIPGKGKSTYTKHFEAGIICPEYFTVNPKIHKDDVEAEWLFVPSDGVRGSGKRVDKCFPIIRKWSIDINLIVVDETITGDVLKKHLEEAGSLIGIGRWRPRNSGLYGRFIVKNFIMTERQ